ncbi:Mbeg1-like protein [Fontibacillus sp. BL9]|uniref:Mbeg1-like protein n=1 Tax=Fontibacillus sp. BL9 TaxID=3389971 RepID=UPI0039794604
MAELTHSQIILLYNLIYLDNVAEQNGKTVGVIINNLLKGELDKSIEINDDGVSVYPGQMEREEWIAVLEAIQKDSQLMSLIVENGDPGITRDKNGQPVWDGKNNRILQKSARMATFVSPDGKEATVVFRGTAGDYEWHDNGTGGYLSDTEMQKAALEYVEKLDYDKITVTGHSKGGSKAQYVAILSDKVYRAVSLDGQGYSKEFTEKYKDEIKENAHKITSISAEYDFVNVLLHTIAEKVIYIDTEKQEELIQNHKPNIVLNELGQLRDPVNQTAFAKTVNDLTIYLSENMEEPDRSYVIDGLIAMLEEGDQGFLKESDEQMEKSKELLYPYVKEYILQKLSEGSTDFAGLFSFIALRPGGPFTLDEYASHIKENTENASYLKALWNDLGLLFGDMIKEMVSEYLHDLAEYISEKAQHVAAGIVEFIQKSTKAGMTWLRRSVASWRNSRLPAR